MLVINMIVRREVAACFPPNKSWSNLTSQVYEKTWRSMPSYAKFLLTLRNSSFTEVVADPKVYEKYVESAFETVHPDDPGQLKKEPPISRIQAHHKSNGELEERFTPYL